MAAACPAEPVPLVRWDARSLTGSVARGASISTWASTGSTALSLVAYSLGGSPPTLQYEDGVPHVRFVRNGNASAGWFQAAAALTLPALYPSGLAAGMTMVVVVRMRTTVDGLTQGGDWERVLDCAATAGTHDQAFTIGRSGSTNSMLFGHKNTDWVWYQTSTNSASINGAFQIFIMRLSPEPSSALYMDGVSRAVWRSNPYAAQALPKTLSACGIGRPLLDPEPKLNGELRELSLYMGAWTDGMVALEYERQRVKWSTCETSVLMLSMHY